MCILRPIIRQRFHLDLIGHYRTLIRSRMYCESNATVGVPFPWPEVLEIAFSYLLTSAVDISVATRRTRLAQQLKLFSVAYNQILRNDKYQVLVVGCTCTPGRSLPSTNALFLLFDCICRSLKRRGSAVGPLCMSVCPCVCPDDNRRNVLDIWRNISPSQCYESKS